MAGPNSGVKADAGILKELGVAVDECQNNLNKAVGALESQVSSLRVGGFEGLGGTAFQMMLDGWKDKARRVIGVLNDFEREIDTTDKANQAQDAAQSEAFNALLAKMDA